MIDVKIIVKEDRLMEHELQEIQATVVINAQVVVHLILHQEFENEQERKQLQMKFETQIVDLLPVLLH